ncbi:hypothetical protein K505DRAFT_419464 [Melanomma pulvis-pyrius CBS 109.77]|uniref:Uncharacterized protein n=1 Tax=Melanomma pulvis-pyrius CBS 109.77 TaxID=1314802 RepID=A0A6A6X4D2_9PLEO|nr:hypothetical protein K505DRAFT_419464 [Melanomma pulvis-pyrius CBS 109.77]
MLVFLPPLLIALTISIVLFIIEQLTISLLNSQKGTVDFYDAFSEGLFGVGIHLNTTPTTLILCTSIVTAILSVLAALSFWKLRAGHEKKARFWASTNIIVTLGNMALAIACMAVSFRAQEGVGSGDLLDLIPIKAPTRETILCALDSAEGRQFWASAGCGLARTGRWMLVPLIIFSVVNVVLCLWQIAERGGAEWLFGGKKRSEEKQLGEYVSERL